MRRHAGARVKRGNRWRTSAYVALGAVVLAALAAGAISDTVRTSVADAWEDAEYIAHPTAILALAIAERHFDSNNVAAYDINRAHEYLMRAILLNPSIREANYELGRIAFLSGNYPLALSYLDRELSIDGAYPMPQIFYMKGLVEGYAGDYADAASDYGRYLSFDPNNWAALNDYGWVLLKNGDPEGAADATLRGLAQFPNNPWLLNTNATANFQLGDTQTALAEARAAASSSEQVTEEEWLTAYPGNDPAVAAEGIAALRQSIASNIHTIASANAD